MQGEIETTPIKDHLSDDPASKIGVAILSGRGHIFNAKDAQILRQTYHICGVLTGVLSAFPQQNVFMGLPLELLREELAYLLHLDAVYIDESASDGSEPDLPSQPQYAMFRYLITKGRFVLPGLRFGCHFMAYPGDPLRYHAASNAVGLRYKEPLEMLHLVGQGRLATTVRKQYVVGAHTDDDPEKEYRAFAIEWAGFG